MTATPNGDGTARRRRLAAIPTLVGMAVILAWPLGAGPATAAETSPFVVQLDSPAGETLTGATSVTVSGRVTAGLAAIVRSIRVQVVRDSDGETVGDATICCATPASGTVPFGPYATPGVSRNGRYHVTVTASGYYELVVGQPEAVPGQAAATFAAAVPPAAPTNVKVTMQADRSALVTWSAVPAYPDFVGYAVYRKTGSGAFQAVKGIKERTTTSFTDTSLGSFSGPIQYQVASIREGVTPDQGSWLIVLAEPVSGTVPAPPTTPPPDGGSTGSTAPGGGLQTGGAATTDLGSFFSSQPAAVPALPSAPPASLPDTGYSDVLPFPSGSAASIPDPIDGRQPGRPSGSSGTGDVETEELGGVNRRALLVPVAAGSVLCVAALHLRWLNRRLALPPGGGLGGPGAVGEGAGGLEIDVDPGDKPFLPVREPVGVSGPR